MKSATLRTTPWPAKQEKQKPMLLEENDSVSQILALPVANFVQASYGKLLGRSPDPVELKSNIGALRCGLGRVRFLENIYRSQEFRTRARQLLYEGSDHIFVAREFAMYLGRSPDPLGLEHYLSLLKKGKSRELVRRDIANSKEAKRSYTFWHELHRLLSDQKNGAHPIKRWIGKSRRESRQRNQEFEILTSVVAASSSHVDRVDQDYSRAFGIDGKSSSHAGHHSPLFSVSHGNLHAGARKILSRLQHASGISSPGRNHS